MRIAQVATLSAPVRRITHGSVESLVWLLSDQLARLGHEVTVFGTADSEVSCKLVGTQPGSYGAPGAMDDWELCEWVNLCAAVERSRDFDVIHTHAYLWGLPLQPVSQAPLVHTLHIVPDLNAAMLWRRWPNACVTAISRHQWHGCPDLKPVAVLPHAVDQQAFPYCGTPDDYLLFMGRFVSGKGPLHAIRIARDIGMRLVLAGPENAYFREHVRPLVDEQWVHYAGFVEGEAKARLLGRARALLYPIQYPESFGLVLVEAMLTGTPVAAVSMGAVPEVVKDGVTGALAPDLDGMNEATRRALALNRHAVRQVAGTQFSLAGMTERYLEVYRRATRGWMNGRD